MQYTVDKEIEYEIFFTERVRRRLRLGYARADDNLGTFLADGIGEDIRHVRFLPQ